MLRTGDAPPVASVSFLNARANRLLGPDRAADLWVRPPHHVRRRVPRRCVHRPAMWHLGNVGVFPATRSPASDHAPANVDPALVPSMP
jgi:hypothetical protein